MKGIALFFVVLAVWWGSGPPVQAQRGDELALALRSNVVAIEAVWPGGQTREGFGFIVAEEDGSAYIATALHVLRDDLEGRQPQVSVRFFDRPGRAFVGQVLDLAASSIDLGVVEVPWPVDVDWQRDVLASANPDRGADVWFIGRNRRWYVPARPGAFNEASAIERRVRIDDLRVRVGTSGAPLLSQDGIIGMIIHDASADEAIAVPISTIRTAFREWRLPWQLVETTAVLAGVPSDREPLLQPAVPATPREIVALPATSPPTDRDPPYEVLETLRVATWNISNFWHVEGEHLRPGAMPRTVGEFDAIRAIVDALDAHVIGLQEMGSPEAVRLIFPNNEWDMAFSRRLTDHLAADPDKLADDTSRDVDTAVVVRRDRGKIVGTERIELDIEHDGRPAREGTAVLVDTGGLRFWAASIHLKSGCVVDNDLSDRADCRTLAQQLSILEDWIDTKSRAGESVVLLGDFNRQLDRDNDVVWQQLNDHDPVELFKVPHGQELVCSAFRAEPTIPIDYVIMSESLWPFAEPSDKPILDVADDRVSDHCPVFVDLDLPSRP